jgi:plastocyanin
MRRLTLFTLLATTFGLLALPDEAEARRWRRWRCCNPCYQNTYYQDSYYQASYEACPCPSQQVAGGYYDSQQGYIASDQYDHSQQGYASQQPGYAPPEPGYTSPDQFTSTEPRPAAAMVEVGAFDGRGFEPKVISIEPGTTVRWTNHGEHRHTVTDRNGAFDSGELMPGETFSFTFDQPGTVEYFCRPHEDMGMVGTIQVGTAADSGEIGNTPDSGAAPAASEQPSGAY